jgi:hypothetical protein
MSYYSALADEFKLKPNRLTRELKQGVSLRRLRRSIALMRIAFSPCVYH